MAVLDSSEIVESEEGGTERERLDDPTNRAVLAWLGSSSCSTSAACFLG